MRSRILGLVCLSALFLAAPAYADLVYSIGNAEPSTVFFVQGQSFTPSVQGNAGTGTPTASPSGMVSLTSFTIDFLDPTSAPSSLYIYTSPPTATDAASGTGSLATGTYVGLGVYDFTTPVSLTFSTKYYAVLPASENIFDGSGNLYTGGVDMFPRTDIVPGQTIVAEGFGDFDIGFTATFQVAAVPEPTTFFTVGLGLLAAGLFGCRRTTRKA